MKAIVKYSLHPRIITIKEKYVSSFSLSFSQMERDDIIKEINNLKTNNATQSIDIPTKRIKEKSDIFGDFIFEDFYSSVFYSIFLTSLKIATIAPVYKKGT